MFRKFNFIAVISILFLFSSCFDSVEEFTINEDGSGEYSMKMDMFKMIEMMSSIGGEDKLKEKEDYDKVEDSTFAFKEYIDAATDLSDEEKRLFRDGQFHMHMSLKEKVSFVKYSFPVKNRADMALVYSSSPKALAAVGNAAKPAQSEGDAASAKGPKSKPALPMMPKAGASNDVFRSGEFFTLENSNGVFSKTVKPEAMKEYIAKDSTLKQMLPMIGNAYSITIVHLPRPAKKVDHSMATLSADRKTVTLKISYTDYFERPELMNFRVEY
jgi:hypothetical protein